MPRTRPATARVVGPAPGARRVALLAVALLLAPTGCDGDEAGPDEGAATATASEAAPVRAEPLDIASLPLGDPPALTYLGGGELHWRGRTVPTDFPADAAYPQLLGAVGDELVVTAYLPRARHLFWSLDRTGQARAIGPDLSWEQHPPRLVRSTGHLWVYSADRTTPWSIRELDARTGALLATYRSPDAPQGLAAADQALVDGWLAGGSGAARLTDRTRDGSLRVDAKVPLAGTGPTLHLRVRETGAATPLVKFSLALADEGSLDAVAFEDREHVLALFTVSSTRRDVDQVVVRCSLVERTCERATEIGGPMALGADPR